MKICQISSMEVTGGAAQATHRLNQGLNEIGINSLMYVLAKRSKDPSVVAFQPSARPINRIKRQIHRAIINMRFERYRASQPAGQEIFSDDQTSLENTVFHQIPDSDVINLHWVTGFIDSHVIRKLLRQHRPVIWTMHDMNPFTGGCHYDDGCRRYTAACGCCPQLGSTKPNDLSRRIWYRKQSVFGQVNPTQLHIVSPSRWLAEEARQSSLLGKFPITIIPNGVDTEIFRPRDHRCARDALEIPQNANVILFVAQSASKVRKGFHLLEEAIRDVDKSTKPFLLSLGSGEPRIDAEIPHLHLGYSNSDRLLALAYSAADVFVIPSLQDNLPNTVLESMACGTPVVGYDIGGVPDMVRPRVTGLLAEVNNVVSLRVAIEELLQNQEKRIQMSANCRKIAVREYSLSVQARSYAQLYRSVICQDSD